VKEEEEENLVAELYILLKGNKKKRENWIDIATKCQKLIAHYGSISEAAAKVGVSYSLLRSIASLLNLPEEVKRLVSEREILYDAAQRILTISDRKKQIEVARAIAGLPSHKQREIIQFASRNPNASLMNFIDRATKPKPAPEKIRIAVLPLREEMYNSLHTQGSRRKLSVEKLILTIIDEWAERNRRAVR
jgi:hypothetical protein